MTVGFVLSIIGAIFTLWCIIWFVSSARRRKRRRLARPATKIHKPLVKPPPGPRHAITELRGDESRRDAFDDGGVAAVSAASDARPESKIGGDSGGSD